MRHEELLTPNKFGLKKSSKSSFLSTSALIKAAVMSAAIGFSAIGTAQAQIAFEGTTVAGTVSGNIDLNGDGVFDDGTWAITHIGPTAITTTFPPEGGVAFDLNNPSPSWDLQSNFNINFGDPEVTFQLAVHANNATGQDFVSRFGSYEVSWVGGSGAAIVESPDPTELLSIVDGPNNVTVTQGTNSIPADPNCNANNNTAIRNNCLDWFITVPNDISALTLTALGGGRLEGFRFGAISFADIVVNKTVSSELLSIGDSGFFTIEVTNEDISGNSVALGTKLQDLLPAGVTFTGSSITSNGANSGGTYNTTTGEWDIGRVSLGETVSLQIDFTVDPGTGGSTITNTIDASTISSAQTDPTDNNNLTASFTVAEPNPSLSMAKVADNTGPYTAGDVVTYRYIVVNDGDQIVRDITITDTHNGSDPAPTPGNETLLTDGGTQGDSTDAAVDGSWDVLAPGDILTFTGTYTITQSDAETL